jgi:hypothetical protein
MYQGLRIIRRRFSNRPFTGECAKSSAAAFHHIRGSLWASLVGCSRSSRCSKKYKKPDVSFLLRKRRQASPIAVPLFLIRCLPIVSGKPRIRSLAERRVLFRDPITAINRQA